MQRSVIGRNSPLMEDEDAIRRRKMAAEKRVQERHRALLAEQKQRNRLTAEERQRLLAERRDREAKEMKKRQEELHHHLEWLERDKARKKEILERQHANTSRTAKKDGVGFGSSTPRELSYLNHLPKEQKAYDKKLTPPPSEPRLSPSKSSPPKKAVNSLMTTSLYVPASTPRRPPPSKLQAPKPARKAPAQNLMTQSVYTPSRVIGMTASAPRAAPRTPQAARLPPPASKPRTPAAAKPPAKEKPKKVTAIPASAIPLVQVNDATPESKKEEKESSPHEETEKPINGIIESSEEAYSPAVEEPQTVPKPAERHFEEKKPVHFLMDEESEQEDKHPEEGLAQKKVEVEEQPREEETSQEEFEQLISVTPSEQMEENPKEAEEHFEHQKQLEANFNKLEVFEEEHKEPEIAHEEIHTPFEQPEEPKSNFEEPKVPAAHSEEPKVGDLLDFETETTAAEAEKQPAEHIPDHSPVHEPGKVTPLEPTPVEHAEKVREIDYSREEHNEFVNGGMEDFILPGAVPELKNYSKKQEISLADELSFALSNEKPESVDESKLIISRPPSPPVVTKNEEIEEIQRRREADQKHNDEVKARFAALKARIGRVSPPNITKDAGLPPPAPPTAPTAQTDNGKPLSDSTAALLSRLSKMGALKSTKAAESVENLLTRHSSDPKIDNAPDDPVTLM